MPRLTCDRPGWGTVRDSETGDRVAIGDHVDRDVAERLAEQYGPVGYEKDAADADAEADADTADEDSEDSDVNDEIADDLLDEHWKTIENQILAGSADDDLDDLRAAEQRRENPRQSVLDALDEREGQLNG